MKKRADGRYCKSIKDERTGRRVYFYAESERELYRKMLDYTARAERGRLFSEVADEWWDLEVETLSPSTVKGYKKATERVVEYFEGQRMKDIQTSDISKFLYVLGKKKQMAKKTVKNHKIILNRIFHFAVVQGDINYNPAREAEIPRGLAETPRMPATPSEEHKIARSQEIWLLPFMALYTGMRKGELRGLKWSDIDMERRLIHVQRSVWDGDGLHIKPPKTKAGDRLIPILTPLYEELQRHTGRLDHFVFGGEKPLSEKAFRYQYQKFQKATGITATVQQLRKSYATMAAGANLDPDVLASIFGHEDITTTLNIYAEVREDRIREAGEKLSTFGAKYGQK